MDQEGQIYDLVTKTDDTSVTVYDNSAQEVEIEKDIEEARETYKTLINKGKESLDVAFTVMEGSQHPKAIEAFSVLLNSIANINKNLVELQTVKKNTLKKSAKESDSPKQYNQTNNLFVGSPKDLLTLIAQQAA